MRPATGVRRAIPRSIHGVRLAITAMARSDRSMPAWGAGVGVEASWASADPARAPWGSTASSCQLPGHAPQLDETAVLEARARADD
jgi:hypothetical protein